MSSRFNYDTLFGWFGGGKASICCCPSSQFVDRAVKEEKFLNGSMMNVFIVSFKRFQSISAVHEPMETGFLIA